MECGLEIIRKEQEKQLVEERERDHDSNMSQYCSDAELINNFFNELAEPSEDFEQSYNLFTEFCSSNVFICNEEQVLLLMQLLESFLNGEDEVSLTHMLTLIRQIIQFNEDFNDTYFAAPEYIELLIRCFPHVDAYIALGSLASHDEEIAMSIFDFNDRYEFANYLQPNQPNLDAALKFFSELYRFDSLKENMIPIIKQIVMIGNFLGDAKIKLEARRFVLFSIQNVEIAKVLISTPEFYFLFQEPPRSNQYYDIILLILREVVYRTKDPMQIIYDHNLQYLINNTLQIEDPIEVGYAADIVGDIAEYGGPEGVQRLISDDIINSLWAKITDEEPPLLVQTCIINALLRCYKNGDRELRSSFEENGFIEKLADSFDVFNDDEIFSVLEIIIDILRQDDSEGISSTSEILFGSEELVDAINEVSESSSERNTILAEYFIRRANE